jgi:flagellar basal body rod protein FlgG
VDDDEEVVYELDEDGFLLNEQGQYVCDEDGNYIQITGEKLEELRAANLI